MLKSLILILLHSNGVNGLGADCWRVHMMLISLLIVTRYGVSSIGG